MSVRENRGEFSTELSAFVSIKDKAISAPSPTEARLIKDIDDGSLHVRVSFCLPERDYNTIDISRWAHGIVVDQTRLVQKSIFIKDIVTASTEIRPRPSDFFLPRPNKIYIYMHGHCEERRVCYEQSPSAAGIRCCHACVSHRSIQLSHIHTHVYIYMYIMQRRLQSW